MANFVPQWLLFEWAFAPEEMGNFGSFWGFFFNFLIMNPKKRGYKSTLLNNLFYLLTQFHYVLQLKMAGKSTLICMKKKKKDEVTVRSKVIPVKSMN